MSTLSTRIPRCRSKNAWSTIEPAMPIETAPIERYDLPRMIAIASPARANRRSFSRTSAGIEPSPASCTSCP